MALVKVEAEDGDLRSPGRSLTLTSTERSAGLLRGGIGPMEEEEEAWAVPPDLNAVADFDTALLCGKEAFVTVSLGFHVSHSSSPLPPACNAGRPLE